MLSDFIEKNIKEDYRISSLLTSKENRGVYTNNRKVVGIQVMDHFILHDNPSQVFEVTTSYIIVLESMKLPSHKNTIEWLEKLRDESQYMMNEM